jgi:hypothetical protein
MSLYLCTEIVILHEIGIWTVDHVKVTLIWVVTSALINFLSISKIKDKENYFKQEALQNLKISIIIDFLVNAFVFNLLIELVLVPISTILAAMRVIAERKEEYKVAVSFIDHLFFLFGVVIIIHVGRSVYVDFTNFATVKTAKEFFVPIALSFLYMPFIYLMLLYLKYERLFSRLPHFVIDPQLRLIVRRRLFFRYHLNMRGLDEWVKRLPCLTLQTETDVLDSLVKKNINIPRKEAPRGFRSFVWGDPPQENLKKLYDFTDGTMYAPPPGEPLEELLGIGVFEEAYSFSENRFYSGDAWLDGYDSYEKAKKAICAQYGPPTFVNEKLFILRWKWPDEGIEISLSFQKRFERTTVKFSNMSQ